MVKFDFESDQRFRASLTDLGIDVAIDILESLDAVSSQQYSWEEFVQYHGRAPLELTGQDTFPGGNELHQFAIQGPSHQLYQVVGYTYSNIVVICAIARRG